MFNDFLDLVFPDNCISCNHSLYKGEKHICTHCRYKLPKTNFHLDAENPMAAKLWGKARIRYGLAYLKFSKGSQVQQILHHIKYKGAKDAANLLGHWYGHDLRTSSVGSEFDIIIPVPMHKEKLKKRGYNQSDHFAQGLAESLQIDYSSGALERREKGSTQTNKGRSERWKNVDGIYQVKEPAIIYQKRVLLVDDVATTGATFETCIEKLYDHGAREVSVGVIAIAE